MDSLIKAVKIIFGFDLLVKIIAIRFLPAMMRCFDGNEL